jgi:hypothetical protein
MLRKVASRLLFLVALSGCALYSDVTVSPLLLTPKDIDRGPDISASMRRADYMRTLELASLSQARVRRSVDDLSAVGTALLAAGRFEDARLALRAALDLSPRMDDYAQIAWNLSQVEYLTNNYEASLEWARIARDHRLQIRPWHLEYLEALTHVVPVYRFSGLPSSQLPLRFGRPDVPRIDVRVNHAKDVQAVIDTGAVLSIISERLAVSLPVQKLGKVEGVFYGLLGEPIPVRFGVIESLELGEVVVQNVPVAIMPDEMLRFFVSDKNSADKRTEFNMDLLLGVNLLKEFRIDLNFDRHRVEFTHLTASDRRPVGDQNLFFEGFRPHVRGTVNRRGWYLFVLDSGSEVTFLNEKQMPNLALHQLAPRGHTAMLQGLGGAQKRGGKIEQVEVGLDRWAGMFKTIPMYSADDRENAVGIIGENYLKHFNVVLDFGRMRLDLVRR